MALASFSGISVAGQPEIINECAGWEPYLQQGGENGCNRNFLLTLKPARYTH